MEEESKLVSDSQSESEKVGEDSGSLGQIVRDVDKRGRGNEQQSNFQEMLKKYPLPEDFLDPSNYLFDSLFLPQEIHLYLKDHLDLNREKLVAPEYFQETIKKEIEESKFTFFGVSHNSAISHQEIAKVLSNFQDTDFALAMEYPSGLQEAFNFFLSTGKFRESDDETKYSSIYRTLQQELAEELPAELKGTIFDNYPEVLQALPILLVARDLKRNVYCIDDLQDQERSAKSETLMTEKLSALKDEHVIVVTGADHAAKAKYTAGEKQIESSSSQLEKQNHSVTSFLWDNFDHSKNWASEDQVTDSVLHAKIKDSELQPPQLLLMDERTLPEYPEIGKNCGFDYFVAV